MNANLSKLRNAVIRVADREPYFTADDVAEYLKELEVEVDLHALGAALTGLMLERVIRTTGDRIESVRPERRGAQNLIWTKVRRDGQAET